MSAKTTSENQKMKKASILPADICGLPIIRNSTEMGGQLAALAKLGFYFVPVPRGGKAIGAPLGKGWAEKKLSSRDPVQLGAWQQEHGRVGLHLGRCLTDEGGEGIIVVDKDIKAVPGFGEKNAEAERDEDLEQRYAFLRRKAELQANGWEVHTGSGGSHYYFAAPKGIHFKNGGVCGAGSPYSMTAPLVDIKAHNGGVVCYPFQGGVPALADLRPAPLDALVAGAEPFTPQSIPGFDDRVVEDLEVCLELATAGSANGKNETLNKRLHHYFKDFVANGGLVLTPELLDRLYEAAVAGGCEDDRKGHSWSTIASAGKAAGVLEGSGKSGKAFTIHPPKFSAVEPAAASPIVSLPPAIPSSGEAADVSSQPVPLVEDEVARIDAAILRHGAFEEDEDNPDAAGKLMQIRLDVVLKDAYPYTRFFRDAMRTKADNTKGGTWQDFQQLENGNWSHITYEETGEIRRRADLAVSRARQMGWSGVGEAGGKTRKLNEAVVGWRDACGKGLTTKDINRDPWKIRDRHGNVIYTKDGSISKQVFDEPMEGSAAGGWLDLSVAKNKKLVEKIRKLLNGVLEMGLGADCPDPQAGIDYFWRFMGYGLRPSNAEHRLFLHIYSQDSAGKGLVLDAVVGALTDWDAVIDNPNARPLAAPVSEAILRPTTNEGMRALEFITNTRIGILQELSDKALDNNSLKRLTGDITAYSRKLYKDGHISLVRCLLISISNREMNFGRDCDPSTIRRIRVLKLRRTLRRGEEDPKLRKILETQQAKDAVLMLLLEGAQKWDEDGEDCPAFVLEDTEDMLQRNSPPTMRWQLRHMPKAPDGDEGEAIPLEEAWENYTIWCKDKREDDAEKLAKVSLNEASRQLRKVGVRIENSFNKKTGDYVETIVGHNRRFYKSKATKPANSQSLDKEKKKK